MTSDVDRTGNDGSLTVSVVWGYLFGVLLLLFVFLVLMPEAEGPSPWDPVAFRKALLELFANFRILDELADMGIIRVADVGKGILNVDLELLAVSNRKFGWAPFYVTLACAAISMLLRGLRQRILATDAGFATGNPGQVTSHFIGRGMNLFFPFGPGDLATARMLDGHEGVSNAAAAVVFRNRVFELVAIAVILVSGLLMLGWGGAVTTVLWTVLLVAAGVSLTHPLGRTTEGRVRGIAAAISEAFNGTALRTEWRDLILSPRLLIGVSLLSVVVLLFEIAALWSIKQAFSSPLDDYVLMKDLAFVPFAVVVAGVAITRIIPYTPGSIGVYELNSVIMFWVHGQGFLAGTTVALLHSILINTVTFVFFVVSLRISSSSPSILETWRHFYRQSVVSPS